MRLDSLKHRVVLLCVVALSLTWFAALALSYHDARREVQKLLDAHLAQAASLLSAQSAAEIDEGDFDQLQDMRQYAHGVSFQIWGQGRTLVLRSENAPRSEMGNTTEGFSEKTLDGTAWRVFTIWDRNHENLIHVGEQVATREHIMRELLEHQLRPVLLSLPILALLLWLAVHLGLRPLERVTGEIAARDPQRLDAVDEAGAPTEVRPLLRQLNALFGRIGESLENTRRFTADAAHELRTPLAAVRAQAQVAQASADAAVRQRALAQVVRGCDLSTHLIEQLLTLARLDASAAQAGEVTDLRALVAEAIGGIAERALDKGVDLALEDGEPVNSRVQTGLLRILLRNLLDNAVRYSPAGSEVSVRVQGADGQWVLDVIDSGPGIPPDELERVFDRFYRIVGSGESGSGLGLSIVRRIAQIHDGDITLQSREGGSGLHVQVRFPQRA